MRRGKTERLTVLPSVSRDRKFDDPASQHSSIMARLRLPRLRAVLVRPSLAVRIVVVLIMLCGTLLLVRWLRIRPTTLVFAQQDLQRVWEWEIAAGHHPGSRPIPQLVGLPATAEVPNPARGAPRTYIAPRRAQRPVPGSIADLDLILEMCDINRGKYARDCLEFLRVGGGLDTLDGRPSESVDASKYAFVEQSRQEGSPQGSTPVDTNVTLNAPLPRTRGRPEAPLELSPTPLSTGEGPCDPTQPRLFHIFWSGPFTDKPYMALLSFLFTQNLGLHNATTPVEAPVCRPQFWVWIHTGLDANVDMRDTLAANPWAAPFLHPRFKDVIVFKQWDTVPMLDSIPELRNDWRKFKDSLLNSGGHVVKAAPAGKKPEYDKPSVVLSDMARFVITYLHGGIYLDADTLLLRDWEDLWGWRGAFAYRWSWHDKYNTAVLRMHARSALGAFIFRTSLRNGLDFHPMTITKYLADAGLDRLLFRVPDALFDPAFLTAEHLQLERPPFPEFQYFGHFFGTPSTMSAAPQVVGFEGFFRGAYSYHWHNFWWQAFDSDRNYPDLGLRFYEGEGRQRAMLLAQEKALARNQPTPTPALNGTVGPKHDLDWSMVIKRTFEAYIRGERPNMYGEWLVWPPDS